MRGTMKDEEILPKLEEILGQLGVELRYEKGDFEGGICRVGEKQFLLVNKRLMLSQKVNLLARELAGLDLSNIYIVPAIRDLLNQHKKEPGEAEA